MIGKFKVWDSKKKYMLSKDWDFFIHQDGRLFFLSKQGINKADPWFTPVFSTGKTDKNGVEVWIGDRLRNKNDHEFTVKHCIEGIETCEKIGSKFEPTDTR